MRVYLRFLLGPRYINAHREYPDMSVGVIRVALHPLSDEQYFVFQCPFLPPVLDRHPVLFCLSIHTLITAVYRAEGRHQSGGLCGGLLCNVEEPPISQV